MNDLQIGMLLFAATVLVGAVVAVLAFALVAGLLRIPLRHIMGTGALPVAVALSATLVVLLQYLAGLRPDADSLVVVAAILALHAIAYLLLRRRDARRAVRL